MKLNSIEQLKITRIVEDLLDRTQKVEVYFYGREIPTARIANAAITNAKFQDASIGYAQIANATITNAKIDNFDAGKITVGTLNADRIAAGSITVDKLDVSELSAITANLGSMNAGTITGATVIGGTIRTSSSGSRVEMTTGPDRLRIYDGLNLRFSMSNGQIVLFGTNALRIFNGSNNQVGYFDAQVESFNIIHNNSSGNLFIQAYNDADIIISADNEVNIISSGPVSIAGVSPKTAIVPYSGGYTSVNCVESPEVWFFDFKDKKKEIDDLFLETVEGDIYYFECTDGSEIVFSRRKGFKNTRFEKKTRIEFERNNRFYAE